MSTKKKAGPKLTEKENPIRLIVPGVYQLRNGRKVTLKKHEGRWVAGHWDRGGFWHNDGCNSINSAYDAMKLILPPDEPKPAHPKPIITGPGEYATNGDANKDGSRKVIVEFKSQCPGEQFPWRGYVKILGSFELESWDDFGRPRSHHGTFPESRFIAGPWVEKKKFLVPCINVNDGHLEVFCLSANDAKEASKFVADNHPESCVGNAMTADELTEYIAAAIRPAIEGVEK